MKFILGLILGATLASIYWINAANNSDGIVHTSTPTNASSNEIDHPYLPEQITLEESLDPPSVVSTSPAHHNSTDEFAQSTNSPAANNEGSPTLPIQTSYEHETMMRRQSARPSVAELHKALELEAIDSTWAPSTESLLSEYLLAHDFIEAFSINHITCRTTMCEIEAFGYEGHQKWNTMMSQMRENGWFKQFSGTSTSSTSHEGKSTVISILHRHLGNGPPEE